VERGLESPIREMRSALVRRERVAQQDCDGGFQVNNNNNNNMIIININKIEELLR
jgi:hypothetical protein